MLSIILFCAVVREEQFSFTLPARAIMFEQVLLLAICLVGLSLCPSTAQLALRVRMQNLVVRFMRCTAVLRWRTVYRNVAAAYNICAGTISCFLVNVFW